MRMVIYDAGGSSVLEKCAGKYRSKGEFWFNAAPMVKPCAGCFGCWLKTPGKCIIKDRCQGVPARLARSSTFVIISPVLYGSYSPEIKAVLDRSIGYILPYFHMVNGEMHHVLRYNHRFVINAFFYGSCNEKEKSTAEKLVRANTVNLGAEKAEIKFFPDISAVAEVFK